MRVRHVRARAIRSTVGSSGLFPARARRGRPSAGRHGRSYLGRVLRRLRGSGDGGVPARTLALVVLVVVAFGSAPVLVPVVGWLIGALT